MRTVIVAVILVGAAIGGLAWTQQRERPFFVSGMIETRDIRVGSRVGGRVAAVHVAEGDDVAAGTVLVELEPYDLEQRLAEAQADRAAQQAALTRLEDGFRAEEIARARAARDRQRSVLERLRAGLRPLELQILRDELASAEADFRKAKFDYERVRDLIERGQATTEELTSATRSLEVAEARLAQARDELALGEEGTRQEEIAEAGAALAEAQAELELVENGYRKEEVAEARARLDAAAARVAAIERQIAELNIVAPIDVRVEAIDLRPGDLVPANAPVVSLLDRSEMWVRAYVPENRLDIAIDDPVRIRVDAFGERRFAGHLSFVSRDAEFTPANVQTPEERVKQVFRIKVVLDEGRDVLRAGMAADVFFGPFD